MPLNKTPVNVSLKLGLNTKVDPKQLDPGQMTALQNAVFSAPDEIQKRFGYTQIGPSTSPTNGVIASTFTTLSTTTQELGILDGENFLTYSEANAQFYQKGKKQIVSSSIIPVQTYPGPSTSTCPFAAQIGNIQLVTWNQRASQLIPPSTIEDGIYFSLVDTVNNIPINNTYENTAYIVAANIRIIDCVVIQNNFVVFYLDGGLNTLKYFVVSADGSTVNSYSVGSSPSILVSTLFGQFTFGATNSGYIFITNTSLAPVICKLDLTVLSSISVTATKVITVSPAHAEGGTIVYDNTNNYVWVLYSVNTPASFYAIYSADLATTVLSPTSVSTFGAAILISATGYVNSSTTVTFFVCASDPATSVASTKAITVDITGASIVDFVYSFPNLTFSSRLFSRVSIDGTTSYRYILLNKQSNLQQTVFLVKLLANGAYEVVGKALSGSSPFLASTYLSSVITPDNDTALFPILYEPQETDSVGALPSSSSVGLIQFKFLKKPQKEFLAQNNLIGGSLPSIYDGENICEQGFCLFPETPTATLTSGSGLEVGSYQYSIVYTWKDALGQTHRSAPSIPVTIATTSGNQSVILNGIDLLYMTNRPNALAFFSSVRIEIYRTAVDQTVFYLIASLSNYNSTANSPYLAAYTDDAEDAAIIGNLQLYTEGGELENIQVSSFDLVTTFKNRAVVVPSENPYEWQYSKQAIQGSPVEFSDLFTQAVDQRGGPITAIVPMDDKLILFKKYRDIFYVVGDGPSPSGDNNDFSFPQYVPTDKGCINPNSTLVTPIGIMFQSDNGLYLLERSLAVSYIGFPVEAYNSASITSAQLISGTTQARFTLDTGICIVYDYFVNQWSTFTNIDAVDSIIYNGSFVYLQSTGAVQQEDTTTYTDNGSFVQMKMTLAWLNLLGIQGFQRIYDLLVLGEYKSPHTLNVDVAYDYDSTIAQSVQIPVTSSVVPYQFRVFTDRQKCEALQLTIYDTQTSSFGEGVSLSGVTLEVGAKKAAWKISAQNSKS